MRIHRRLAIPLVVALSCGCGAAAAVAAGVTSDASPPTRVAGWPAANSRTGIQSVPLDVAVSFPAFARGRNSLDDLPSSMLGGLAQEQSDYGVNPGLSRLLLSSASAKVWLVPGHGLLCMVAEEGPRQASSIDCTSATNVEQTGIFAAGPHLLAGTVPEGTTDVKVITGSGDMRLTPVNNAIAFETDAIIQSLSYETTDGMPHDVTLAMGPPAGGP